MHVIGFAASPLCLLADAAGVTDGIFTTDRGRETSDGDDDIPIPL